MDRSTEPGNRPAKVGDAVGVVDHDLNRSANLSRCQGRRRRRRCRARGDGRVLGVEALDRYLCHAARVVETELEPVVLAEVRGEAVEATAVVGVVTISRVAGNGRRLPVRHVRLPVDIRRLDYPSVVRC